MQRLHPLSGVVKVVSGVLSRSIILNLPENVSFLRKYSVQRVGRYELDSCHTFGKGDVASEVVGRGPPGSWHPAIDGAVLSLTTSLRAARFGDRRACKRYPSDNTVQYSGAVYVISNLRLL